MQYVSRRRGGAWPARPLWSREGGPGSNGRKMAALKEDRSYGLSCGRVSDGSKVSVFHVKLTDSALRAFETYRASQVSGVAVGDVGVPAGLACPSPGVRASGRGVWRSGCCLWIHWPAGCENHVPPWSREATLAIGPGRRWGRNSRA